jgi:sugar (pentulose or hexulose) kinase
VQAGAFLHESTGVRRGMWTLSWLLDLLGPELADRAATAGSPREHLLEAEAQSVPAGADGLLTMLDWLAPIDHPYRRGVMLGFDARHTRGHMYRSVLEAIAMAMNANVRAMVDELRMPLRRIVVSGGGAASDLFMQITADVFGVDVSAVRGQASPAALGAAACAAAAAELYPSIEDAARALAAAPVVVQPDAAAHDLYQRIGAVMADARSYTDPLLQRTHPLSRP